ncbi:alginate lyase-domain-containing protein [Auriculariales sp. MPI-PUGE-AT-0066]|nr:alginate lyase-domain-containing protein [Auriculariales sp. MPI-PUGE-AT-0066]
MACQSRRRRLLVASFFAAVVAADINVFVDPAYVLQFAGTTLASQAQDYIVSRAPSLAALGPWSVRNQTILPGSNNPKDYLSWAPYWWPDCNWCLNNSTSTSNSASYSTASSSITRRADIDDTGRLDWLHERHLDRNGNAAVRHRFLARAASTTKKTTTSTSKKASTTTKKSSTTTKKSGTSTRKSSTSTKKLSTTTSSKSSTSTKKSSTSTAKSSTTTQKVSSTTKKSTSTTTTSSRGTTTSSRGTTTSSLTRTITTTISTTSLGSGTASFSTTSTTNPRSSTTSSPTTSTGTPYPSGCRPSPTTPLPPSATWTTCPYIRKDGQVNPDVRAEIFDTTWITQLSESVFYSTLGAATGRYPQGYTEAARHIRTWFINSVTGVNPNLNWGQIVNAVLIMRSARAPEWTSADDAALIAWAKQYLVWLTTSTLGKQDAASKNNHATFYYNQLAVLHVLVGNKTAAVNSLNTYFNGLFRTQIIASGEQPEESARTLPGHYQAFNVEAMVVNARIGDYLGQNYWVKTTSQGATIQTAVNYLMQRAVNPTTANASPSYNTNEIAPHVAVVAVAYGDPTGKYGAWLRDVAFATGQGYQAQPWWFYAQPESLPYSPYGRGVATSSRSYPAYTYTPTSISVSTTPLPTTTGADGGAT